jgi:hypothetical protein
MSMSASEGLMNMMRSSAYSDAQWRMALRCKGWRSDQSSAFLIMALRASITRRNNIGDKRSPWRNRRACQIFGVRHPFTVAQVLAVVRREATQSSQIARKPIWSSSSWRKGHTIELKAHEMSTFRTRHDRL